MNIAEINNAMSDEDFEILLRLRLTKAFDECPKGTSLIMLVANTGYTDQIFKSANWNIGAGDNRTSGEILSQCVVEHNRRQAFSQSCTLRMIEGKVEPAA
jgi:hypothetical protein